jgi:cobalt-precorrin-5B (C1)-methyltransferase
MPATSKRELRRGWTTGACACAAASAAFSALLDRRFREPVEISLPGGRTPRFPLARRRLEADVAEAGVVKDSGDDPDVTHGVTVVARLRPLPPGAGIVFRAGEGVGTVTLPGLPLPPGEPAINPAPRRMITRSLAAIAEAHGVSADVEVEISIPGGTEIAAKTMNGRLGIVGGLSVLGNTGVVIPYSCSAWVFSLHEAVDVARASGLDHLAATTGKTSEAGLQQLYHLPDLAMIDMGDFAGGLLKYLKRHPVSRLTLGGGFAKLAKLGAGALDLHSARSHVDLPWLAGLLGSLGASDAALAEASEATTALALLRLAQRDGLPLSDLVAERARAVAAELTGPGTAIEMLVFDRDGNLVGRAG